MIPTIEALLNEVEAAARLGISPRTLQLYRQRGLAPPYVKLSPLGDGARGAIRYRPADVDALRLRRAEVHA
jgi:DNA-binding transcriptional MerR regulator